MLVGCEEDEYIPSSRDMQDIEKDKLKSQEQKNAQEDRPQAKPQAQRVKKQWKNIVEPEVMPVQDHSQERKEWKRPAPIPKAPKKEEEFEVVTVDQSPDKKGPKIEEQNVQPGSNMFHTANISNGSNMQFTSQLAKDHFQIERMIADMKNNLFMGLDNEDDETEVETSIDDIAIVSNINDKINGPELKASEPKIETLPEITKEEEEDREDLDCDGNIIEPKSQDDENQLTMKGITFGDKKESSGKSSAAAKSAAEKIDEDLEKYNNVERIKDYLEIEIGKDVLEKAHPILKELGDDILYEQNIPDVIDKLKGILSEDKVKYYLHFFASLIFFEEQAEQLSKILKD